MEVEDLAATYNIGTGAGTSLLEVMLAVKRVTGKELEAVWISPDDYFERFYGKGQGEGFRYELALIRAVGLWYTQYVFAGNPNVLTWLFGRSPVTLDEFIGREWKKYQSAQA